MGTGSVFEGGGVVSSALELFIVQLLLIVVLSRILAFILKPLKQPPVCAEIIAGILLGPTVLCRSETFQTHIFPAASLNVLSVFANVGLIIFLFLIGLESDLALVRRSSRTSIFISAAGIALPFGLGCALSKYLYDEFGVGTPPAGGTSEVSFGVYLLFVSCAVSITAFPVLARILTERKLLNTTVGIATISAAAIDDIAAWCILALVVSLARAGSNRLVALYTCLTAIGLILFLIFIVRPVLSRLAARSLATRRHLPHYAVVLCFMGMFFFAWMTEWIGIHAIFGAFAFGLTVPREGGLNLQLCEKLEDLVVSMFLPLYFTLSGLKTNLGLISSGNAGGATVLVIVTAVVGKFGGCTTVAKLMGHTTRNSFTIGILMNCKGLVELVVLNIGLDNGIISQQLFSMCVVMALVCTFMTTPLTYLSYPKHFVVKDMVERMAQRLQDEKGQGDEAGRESAHDQQLAAVPSKKARGHQRVLAWLCGDNAHAFPLLTLAASVTAVKGPRNISLLKLTTTSNRPSSYMRHMMSAGDQSSGNWRSMLTAHAGMLRVGEVTDVIAFASDEPVSDVIEVATTKNSGIVIMGFPAITSAFENDAARVEAHKSTELAVKQLGEKWEGDLGIFFVREMAAVLRRVVCAVAATESQVAVENDVLAMRMIGQMAKSKAASDIVLLIAGPAHVDMPAVAVDMDGSDAGTRTPASVPAHGESMTTLDGVAFRNDAAGTWSRESSYRIRSAMDDIRKREGATGVGVDHGDLTMRLADAIESVLVREQRSKSARKITRIVRRADDSLEDAIVAEVESTRPDLLVMDYNLVFGDATMHSSHLAEYVTETCKCSVLLVRRDIHAARRGSTAGTMEVATGAGDDHQPIVQRPRDEAV